MSRSYILGCVINHSARIHTGARLGHLLTFIAARSLFHIGVSIPPFCHSNKKQYSSFSSPYDHGLDCDCACYPTVTDRHQCKFLQFFRQARNMRKSISRDPKIPKLFNSTNPRLIEY